MYLESRKVHGYLYSWTLCSLELQLASSYVHGGQCDRYKQLELGLGLGLGLDRSRVSLQPSLGFLGIPKVKWQVSSVAFPSQVHDRQCICTYTTAATGIRMCNFSIHMKWRAVDIRFCCTILGYTYRARSPLYHSMVLMEMESCLDYRVRYTVHCATHTVRTYACIYVCMYVYACGLAGLAGCLHCRGQNALMK